MSMERRIKACIEKFRFVATVRAPWVKKHLKLKCSLATVPRRAGCPHEISKPPAPRKKIYLSSA